MEEPVAIKEEEDAQEQREGARGGPREEPHPAAHDRTSTEAATWSKVALRPLKAAEGAMALTIIASPARKKTCWTIRIVPAPEAIS
jgi:hypothetical protein